jgi:hypothetical protein
MKRIIVSLLIVALFSVVKGQNGYQISKPEPSFKDNILTVKYDITGCGRNEFVDITLILINSKGDTLKPRYITGDIGKSISCGLGKSIEWNLEKDKIKMETDLEVLLKGVKSVAALSDINSTKAKTLSRGNIILSSVLIPGLGQKKASGKSVHLIFSGLVYGSLGGSIYLAIKANDYKSKYNAASGTLRDEMFVKWQDSYNNSKNLIYCAAGTWVANLVWAAVIPIKTDNNKKSLKVSFAAPAPDNLLVSAKWTF